MTRERRRLSSSHDSAYIETHSTEHMFVGVETSDLPRVGTRSLAASLRYLWPCVPVASEHVVNGQCGFDITPVVVGQPGFDEIELDSPRASLGHIRTERPDRRRCGRYQRLTPVVALRIHRPEVRS